MRLLNSTLLLFVLYIPISASAKAIEPPLMAPEFTQQDPAFWLNSRPQQLKQLRGNVVLLDFWTFDCWNCYRSFPWLHQLEERLVDSEFNVIGIHTPEFTHEKVRASLVAKIDEFEIKHPVMMDNDFLYWQAMSNRYWPTFYILDKQGRVRSVYIGETHTGSKQAMQIEADIRIL